MTDETQDVVQDNQQIVPAVVEETKEQPVTDGKSSPSIERNDEEHNWQRVHAVLEAQKAELDSLRTELQKKTVAPEPEEEPDELANLDPNEYFTVAQLREMRTKMEQRAERKAIAAAQAAASEVARQQSISIAEQQAKAVHEDYDYVVEHFAIPLIKNDPALAHKVMNSKNPAETAYKLGKLSDQYEEQMAKQTTSPKAEKILKNTQRPTSSNAVSSSLRTTADKYSNMSPREIWEQSQKWAKQA